MIVSPELVDQIIAQSDIVSLINQYTKLDKKGETYLGCCPFHNEKTPSFSVNPSKKVYHCFGCKKGGNIVGFLMDIDKLTYPEALAKLAKPLGIALEGKLNQEQERHFKEIATLKELYKKVQIVFEHFLYKEEGRVALNYILSRGISHETVKLYRLGYCPADGKWLYNFLLSKGYSIEFLAKSGFFSNRFADYGLFTDRLTFPVINFEEEVIAFSCRSLPHASDTSPKYINSPDTAIYNKKKMLYGLSQAKESLKKEKKFILCEGTVDALAMRQMGFANSVAVLGSAFTIEQATLIKRYASEALLMFDNDEAGQKALERSIIILEKLEMESRIVKIEGGKDAGEILQKNNSNFLTKNVLHANFSFDFLLNETYQSNTTSLGKAEQVCKTMFPQVVAVVSPLRRAVYLEKIANRLSIELSVINAEYEHFKQQNRNMVSFVKEPTPNNVIDDETPNLVSKPANKDKYVICLEKILLIFFVRNDLFEKYKDDFCENEILDENLREQLVILKEDSVKFSYHFLLEKGLATAEQQDYFIKKINPIWEEDLVHLLKQLKKISLEKQKKEIDEKIEILLNSEPAEENANLQEKLLNLRITILKELKKIQK